MNCGGVVPAGKDKKLAGTINTRALRWMMNSSASPNREVVLWQGHHDCGLWGSTRRFVYASDIECVRQATPPKAHNLGQVVAEGTRSGFSTLCAQWSRHRRHRGSRPFGVMQLHSCPNFALESCESLVTSLIGTRSTTCVAPIVWSESSRQRVERAHKKQSANCIEKFRHRSWIHLGARLAVLRSHVPCRSNQPDPDRVMRITRWRKSRGNLNQQQRQDDQDRS